MAETETIDLDTSKEPASPNGHTDEVAWLEFDDDLAFINQINAQQPAEELVPIPEWKMKILCRALSAEDRIKIQKAAYDSETKTTDYRRAIYEVIMAGCFNPKSGHKAFRETHRNMIMRDPRNGTAAERLFVAILRISGMLPSTAEQARKN